MKRGALMHRQLTFEAMVKIAERIAAKREAWRNALGVCRGFDIPDAPTPATLAEIEAEIAFLTELEHAAFNARVSLQPGMEREARGLALVEYSGRRWRLMALRDREIRSERAGQSRKS